MTAITDEITLPVLFQRLESHLYVCKNWKMMSATNVTCREELFVKVPNSQFHHTLAYLGVVKDLVCIPTAFQSNVWTEVSNGCGFDLELFDLIKFLRGEAKFHLQEISGALGVTTT